MFPKTLYLWIELDRGDGYWKTLCVVYDNESLGFLERNLAEFKTKVVDANGN